MNYKIPRGDYPFTPNSESENELITIVGSPYPVQMHSLWFEENGNGEKRLIEYKCFKLVEIKDE